MEESSDRTIHTHLHTHLWKRVLGTESWRILTIKTVSVSGGSNHIRGAHSLKGNLLGQAAELPELTSFPPLCLSDPCDPQGLVQGLFTWFSLPRSFLLP